MGHVEIEKRAHNFSAITEGQVIDRSFNIEITFDPESQFWCAVCDEIGLVTEEKSVDAVIERSNLIIPDLLELNGFPVHDVAYEFIYRSVHSGTVIFN